MVPRRGALLLVAVWVLGVVAATTIGLIAVRQVRVEVGDPSSQPLGASEVNRDLDSSSTPTVAASRATPPTRSATRSATPSARPTAVPSPRLPAATRPASPRASASTASPSRTLPPPPPQRRTFTSKGGSVAVQCSGSSASIVYVLPASGWQVEERKVEGDRVEVQFSTADDDAEIKVRCSTSGTPVADSSDE